jgi:hypothetical protein
MGAETPKAVGRLYSQNHVRAEEDQFLREKCIETNHEIAERLTINWN